MFGLEEKEPVVFTKYILSNGQLAETDDDRKAIAKHSDEKFFVKFSNQSGDFYSPWGTFNMEDELLINEGGIPKYVWTKVPEKSYNLYLKYLTSKNPAYFNRMKETF